MFRKLSLTALLLAVMSMPIFLAGCETTPNTLTGSGDNPTLNDKNRVLAYPSSGYQAR